MQHCTQVYGRRPYGVGMLVAGYDVRFNTHTCTCIHSIVMKTRHPLYT